jgi:hypothetical protein
VITGEGTRIGNNMACTDSDGAADLQRCLTRGGLDDIWATYHPQSHFWPLQLAETGVVLAVAALAVTAAFVLLRRRTAPRSRRMSRPSPSRTEQPRTPATEPTARRAGQGAAVGRAAAAPRGARRVGRLPAGRRRHAGVGGRDHRGLRTGPDRRLPTGAPVPAPGLLDYGGTISWASTLVYYSFFAVAAFAAGALIGRELENGTAQLAWTQSVSPTRWLAATLAVPAALLTVGGTVFVLVFRWAWAANRDLMGDDWTFTDVFAARGPALVAYGLCGLAVGRARRGRTAAVAARAGGRLRGDVPGQPQSGGAPRGSVAHGSPDPTKGVEMSGDVWQIGDGTGRFHPQSHYWPMHLVETGIVLGVAVLATGSGLLGASAPYGLSIP